MGSMQILDIKRKNEKKNKLPSCIGNFGKHHSFCIDECRYNTLCEECSGFEDK